MWSKLQELEFALRLHLLPLSILGKFFAGENWAMGGYFLVALIYGYMPLRLGYEELEVYSVRPSVDWEVVEESMVVIKVK